MCALFLFLATTAFAQNARVSGQVTDSQGAAIPNASLQVTNQDTAVTLTAKTDGSGNYTVPYLAAGHYQVIVQAPGFNQSIGNVALGMGQAFFFNVQLTVGGAQSTVTVEGGGGSAATEINTESAEVSGTITGKEVTSLQLNGRNFAQLITLTPGVSNQSQQDEALVGPIGQAKYSFNGGRTEYNSFEVDGSDVLNLSIYPTAAPLIVTPSLDAIQEIKVMTSNYGAMYGRTASGVVVVSTKSGTSQFHGNAYEFLRNEAFNSRNYFDPGTRAPLYRRNDFGSTMGGPLYIPHAYNTGKNKTFFFFSEEFRRDQSPTSYRVGAPTAKEFTGNFEDLCPSGAHGVPNDTYQMTASDLLTYSGCPLYLGSSSAQPYLGSPQNGSGGDPVPGNMEPNMAAILASGIIPVANTSKGGCNSNTGNCYNATHSPLTTWREELFRIDHDITSRHRLLLRYIHDAWDTTVLSPQWGFMATQNTYPTVQNRFTGPGINVLAGVSSTLTPSLLNSLSFSYTDSQIALKDVGAAGVDLTRSAQLNAPACANGSSRTDCPMGYMFNNGFGNKLPGFAVVGSSAGYGGGNIVMDTGYMPWEHTSPTYNLTDNLTKIIGKHSLQGGTQVILLERNQTNSAVGAASGDVQGFLTFRQLGSTNDTFYNLLTGAGLQSYQQDSGQGRFHQRAWVAEPYLQDDWRLTHRLTLNLGLRASLFGNFYERGRDLYNWDPKAFSHTVADTLAVDPYFGYLFTRTTGAAIPRSTGVLDPRISNGLVHCGYGGVPASCMSSSLWNPAPRVGFAWDITGRGQTALRGGYGIFYEHGTPYESNTGSLEANPPAVTSVTQYNPISITCIGGGVAGENCGGAGQSAYPISLTSIPTKAHWSYAQQWNLSFQQQLPRDVVLTVGYVGSRGTHLTAELQLNQLQPVPDGLNPYGAHVPFQTGDCSGLSGPDSLHPIQEDSLAYFDLSAVCGEAGVTGGLNSLGAIRVKAPGLDKIISIQPVASSSYHGFQMLARRTKASLTVDAAYTYSHSIDDSSDRTELPVNGLDIHQNKASSSFDQRHLFEVSYIYQLHLDRVWLNLLNWAAKDPDDDGKPIYAVAPISHAAHVLLDSWELSGLTLFQTGTPFSVYNSGSSTNGAANGLIAAADNAGVANGLSPLYSSYPDLVGSAKKGVKDAQLAGGNNSNSFGPLLLNPGAFAAPRGLTFGNAGRNVLNNPRRTNFDMSLLKHLSIFRENDLEFRVESYNIFNHTQFRIFDPTLGNQSGNTVSCYGPQTGQYSAGFAGDSTNSGCLTGSGFLHPVDAHRPRTLQFGLKMAF
jgi:hypothetical protein